MNFLRKLLDFSLSRPRPPLPDTAAPMCGSDLAHRRFLSDKPVSYPQSIAAAESYVSKLQGGEVSWLHCKPFDATPGNPQYFRLTFCLLNLLQTLQIKPQGRILEVGSGPGWVTEILLMLGFTVDALEPSGDLIDVSRQRCSALSAHYQHATPPKVTFHQTTMENSAFESASFDAVLFFDTLHHVVHEELAIKKCFHYLKPGGGLGITEGSWHPDFKALEQSCIDEMAQYGTLENPFSTQYLDFLLDQAGFKEVKRHVAVNGFFCQHQIDQPLKNFADQSLASSNNVTARKPCLLEMQYPHCTTPNCRTDVQMRLLSGGIDAQNRTAKLQLQIANTGETLLSHRTQQAGHITVALRQGKPGSRLFLECAERHVLSATLVPGDELTLDLKYTLPAGAISLDNWALDLVAESCFWFSSLGIQACAVPVLVKP